MGPFSNQHSNHSIYILVHQSIFREQCSENTFKNCLFTKFPAIHPKKENNGMNTAASIHTEREEKKERLIFYMLVMWLLYKHSMRHVGYHIYE